MEYLIGVLFWTLIAYVIYKKVSKRSKLKNSTYSSTDPFGTSHSKTSKFKYATPADERELERLILTGNKEAVHEWIDKKNKAQLVVDRKVYARARNFVVGKEWLTDEAYEAKINSPGYADEKLMEELENLLVTEDKKLVREFLKEYKVIGLPLPQKVEAKAKAFLAGRAWKFEDEIAEVQDKDTKKPVSRSKNTQYKKQLLSLTFTAIDFETANSARNSACSIGYVRVVEGEVKEEGYTLIKPKNASVNAINRSIHGITDQEIANAPDFTEVWKQLEPFISDNVVVAHNCDFDAGVLLAMLEDHNLPTPEFKVMCSHKLAQEAFSDLRDYRLNDVAAYFNIELEHHHALSDAKVCAQITINALKSGHDFGFKFSYPEITQHISKRASETKKDRSLKSVYSKNKLNVSQLQSNLDAENRAHPFYNKGIVFTGDLASFTRQKASEKATAVGAIVKSGISKKVHFVIAGSNAGPAKLKKIEELQNLGCDIRAIDETKFLALLNSFKAVQADLKE